MNPGAIATVVLAVLAVLGSFAGMTAWFFKRGGDERTLTDAVHANTAATNKLTESVSSLRGTLNEHESRIRVLEEREYRIHEYRIKSVEGDMGEGPR
jgi:hypothetical protein